MWRAQMAYGGSTVPKLKDLILEPDPDSPEHAG
jgi:hypothetical protein